MPLPAVPRRKPMSFLASVTENLKKQISPCSGSQFKIPVQHVGEVTVGGAGLLTSIVKEGEWECLWSAHFLLSIQSRSQPRECCHPQWTGFLTSVKVRQGQKHTSQVTMTPLSLPLALFLHMEGDSRAFGKSHSLPEKSNVSNEI